MSAIKKTAKVSLYLFSFFVLVLVAGAIYLYTNMDSIAKQLTEKVASDALGVPVTIGSMSISIDDLKVLVNDIRVTNPKGYNKPKIITVEAVTVAAESFSKELLTFALVSVEGTNVNLEVSDKGTNLGDLKNNINRKSSGDKAGKKPSQEKSAGGTHDKGNDIKVIIKNFALTKAQLKPSVTLLGGDLSSITVPDIHLSGIGQKENGILAREAIAQVMDSVLQNFNNSANSAGFLKGLPLEALNAIGVSTAEVFKKNLKESYEKEVEGLKKGFEDIKGIFE